MCTASPYAQMATMFLPKGYAGALIFAGGLEAWMVTMPRTLSQCTAHAPVRSSHRHFSMVADHSGEYTLSVSIDIPLPLSQP